MNPPSIYSVLQAKVEQLEKVQSQLAPAILELWEKTEDDAKISDATLDVVGAIQALPEGDIAMRPLQAKDLPFAFLAQSFGFWAVDKSADLAVLKLSKLGAVKTGRVFIDLIIGDDSPRVINGGMNIEYKAGSAKIRVGEHESLSAFLRNYVKP